MLKCYHCGKYCFVVLQFITGDGLYMIYFFIVLSISTKERVLYPISHHDLTAEDGIAWLYKLWNKRYQ